MINLIQGLIDKQPNEFHLEIIEDFDSCTVTSKAKASLTNVTIDRNIIIFDTIKPTISECLDQIITFSKENNIEFSHAHLEAIRRNQPAAAKFIFGPPIK